MQFLKPNDLVLKILINSASFLLSVVLEKQFEVSQDGWLDMDMAQTGPFGPGPGLDFLGMFKKFHLVPLWNLQNFENFGLGALPGPKTIKPGLA